MISYAYHQSRCLSYCHFQCSSAVWQWCVWYVSVDGGYKGGNESDEKTQRQLTKFEREGTQKYLYVKRCEEEKDAMSKTADSMLHNKVDKTEKKAERTLHT